VLPNSLVTLLAFLLVVAPGCYAESLYERRRPARHDSALREASRIAQASIFLSVASALLIALGTQILNAGPNLTRIVNDDDKHTYLHTHYEGVVVLVLIEFLLALALARFAHAWITLEAPATLVPTDLWHQILRVEAPGDDAPYLRVRLADGWVVEGRLGWARYDSDPACRELALAVPLYSKHGERERAELHSRYRWVILKNSDIQRIDVAYMSVPPATPSRQSRARGVAIWIKRRTQSWRVSTPPRPPV
jgi:hypothetical protein